MLKIALCDDESVEIEYLSSLAREWAETSRRNVNISTFQSAEAFLFEYEEDKSFDILILDIQMKGMDGIELAEKIRESNSGVQIIFITGYPDYISMGYDVSALHYLIKPVEKQKLFSVLDKAEKNLNKAEKFILLSVESENIRLRTDDIIYIEAFGHSSNIVCKNGEYSVKMPISDVFGMLDGSFVYCHRSYVINLRSVSSITKTDIIFDDGKNVPVSRRMYGAVNTAFINYYGGI